MGLFDRLFRQEKTDSQETLANKELTEVFQKWILLLIKICHQVN